jgi:glutamine synthetase
LQDFEEVFLDIAAVCREQGVPADTTLRENGPGQYEINLNHVPDALRAADNAVLLKRIVKGVARKHGLDATFMAKPYGMQAGSGMHVHFSILDEQGRNIFAGENGPSDALMHSVGGLLNSMHDSTAIFAPHANSYRRLTPSEHAPTYASWGHRQPFRRRARHRRGQDGDPHRTPRRGRRQQSLSRARRDPAGRLSWA